MLAAILLRNANPLLLFSSQRVLLAVSPLCAQTARLTGIDKLAVGVGSEDEERLHGATVSVRLLS